jgi:hypothetical protein
MWRIAFDATQKKCVRFAGPAPVLLDELQIRLVDERRRVQREVASPAMPVPVRQRPQLGVHEGEELAERVPVTRLQLAQEVRDCGLTRFGHRGHPPHPAATDP